MSQAFYDLVVIGSGPAGQKAAQVNGATGNVRNYSPTAFLVNASLPAMHARRHVDYVATVVFTPGAAVDKAKRLSQNPVP